RKDLIAVYRASGVWCRRRLAFLGREQGTVLTRVPDGHAADIYNPYSSPEDVFNEINVLDEIAFFEQSFAECRSVAIGGGGCDLVIAGFGGRHRRRIGRLGRPWRLRSTCLSFHVESKPNHLILIPEQP